MGGNLCYVNNHTCSTTSPPSGEGETHSSPPEQGRVDPLQDGDRPPAHPLCCQKSTADPRPLLPPPPRRQTEHCSSSGRRVKTTKSTQWKKAPGSCNARRLRRKPTRSRRPRHKQGGNY